MMNFSSAASYSFISDEKKSLEAFGVSVGTF